MITRVRLHNREGLGFNKLHQTGGELGPNTLQFVARNAVPKAVTLSEIGQIESARAKDPMLQAIMSVVKSGFWHNAPPDVSISEPSRYEQVKEQLTCTDTVLLKSDGPCGTCYVAGTNC